MPPKGEWSEVMTVDQVAAYLQLNKLTVYRYIRDGLLPAARIGKGYRLRKSDIDAFLQSRMTRPAARRAARPTPPTPGPQPAPEQPRAVSKSEPAELRGRGLSVNPMEWVTRGLH